MSSERFRYLTLSPNNPSPNGTPNSGDLSPWASAARNQGRKSFAVPLFSYSGYPNRRAMYMWPFVWKRTEQRVPSSFSHYLSITHSLTEPSTEEICPHGRQRRETKRASLSLPLFHQLAELLTTKACTCGRLYVRKQSTERLPLSHLISQSSIP